ncbi:hypothetical protein DR64_7968 [Paraburkholderia xenovorans LB400]|nr:hypothetical protein DR64_7968 [Paraburkholderia xenovorans LB400]
MNTTAATGNGPGASAARRVSDGIALTGVPSGPHRPGFVIHCRMVGRGTGEVSPVRTGGEPSACVQ